MNVDKQIMSLFYRSIVESVMSYCIISWFGSSHKKDQHKLAKIGKIAKRMGVNSKNLNELYQNDCINYVFPRSGRRLNLLYICSVQVVSEILLSRPALICVIVN